MLLWVCGLLEFFWEIIMAKIKRGYTKRKEPYISKASPHKDIPVLKDKVPDRPRKSTRGSKYRPSKSSSLAAFHSSERAVANENKSDTGRSKARSGHSRSGSMGGGYADIYHHPKLGRRKIGIRKEPKL